LRIGIFGGSFDPVHLGHIGIARAAIADLSLDKLIIVPASVSPFKTNAAPKEGLWQRLELVKAAFAPVERTVVDLREIERGGVSYAIDTVSEIVSEGDIGDEYFFIVGEDAAVGLAKWKDIDKLKKLCTFKVYPRTKESSSRIRELFKQSKSTLNPDEKIVSAVRAGLVKRNGYCPCRLAKLPEFFCPCEEFMAQMADPSFSGMCHCRLYLKP
jgi:nicotinate (nicotinamide) nucleotide adenylyltransferase